VTRANGSACVKIFGTDEADDRVDEHRREFARYRIGARLERLLVDAMMRIRRQRRALHPGKIGNVDLEFEAELVCDRDENIAVQPNKLCRPST
jgi:hypothetical protein